MQQQWANLTILLMVFDMPRSLQFYVDGLGFEIVQSAGPEGDIGWAMLRRESINLMLNTLYELPERPDHPDTQQIKHHGDTILYFGCPALASFYEALLAKGLRPSPLYQTGYGFQAMDLTDPDGYKLCFQWELEAE